MPRPFRINLEKLQLLHEAGKTGVEISRELGCGPPAISKALKKLGLAKCNQLLKAAEKIQRRQLRAEDRILSLDENTHTILEEIRERLKGTPAKEREAVESHLLQFIAEGRKQMCAWADVRQKLVLENDIRAFKECVLEVIKEVSPEVQSEIFRRLSERDIAESVFGRIERRI